jgi:putative cell wall-binding protein
LILKEAGVAGKDILVCTGKGFADSLSASAAKLPILLVKDSLNSAQKEFLNTVSGKKYVIGGKAAVNEKIETALKAYGEVKRLGGNTRYETSVLVAKEFFSAPKAAVLAYAQNFPDGLSGGALACGVDAPLILTASGKEKAAAAYTKDMTIKAGYTLGGTGLINDKAVKSIFAMAETDTITVIK